MAFVSGATKFLHRNHFYCLLHCNVEAYLLYLLPPFEDCTVTLRTNRWDDYLTISNHFRLGRMLCMYVWMRTEPGQGTHTHVWTILQAIANVALYWGWRQHNTMCNTCVLVLGSLIHTLLHACILFTSFFKFSFCFHCCYWLLSRVFLKCCCSYSHPTLS